MKRASALLTRWYLVLGALLTVVCIAAPWKSVRELMYVIAAAQRPTPD